MLQETAEDLGSKQFISDLQKIHGAGKHLLTLINDILDLSKVEAGKMTLYLEEFEIGKMVRDVAQTVHPLIARNNNQFVLECPSDIGLMRADLTKVRQTLFNLLSNAGKFTQNGTITLRASRSDPPTGSAPPKAGGSVLTFTVTDTGIGMTPAQMEKLFLPFSQADASTTRKFGGTGLGLAISRKFCELLGGTLSVQSESGKGSTFVITLPSVVEPAGAEPSAPVETGATGAPAQGAMVLVIDDDAAAREMTSRVLSKEGFAVQCASNGPEGLELARRLGPAVIALDVMMPSIDGWAVLAALKADPQLARIPVIMMTIVDERNLGFALGAADYFTKPIDWNRLATVLSKYHSAPGGVRALVVEDDLPTQDLLKRNLERDGWSVALAGNGRIALETLAAQPAHLILLDLMMPEMDGFEFLDQLRRVPEWRKLPVVVITSKDLTEEDRRRLNGGVARIIQKGALSFDELLASIRSLAQAGLPNHRFNPKQDSTHHG